MASLIKDFEYDIFISYRHNDNRSGWVTDFVNALQEELAATIKEPPSIYFDKNPHDGLLETHSVDKSLEGKLKCLIFIPIISQTYCDTKSFAWQHEFCAFNKLSKGDQFGRDIKLSNGNVASRILPIKIHDLDAEDKNAIENELSGALRSIEFIYRSAGVNRPLTPSDKKEETANKTFYRDQINKTANAIKEIVQALTHPGAKPVLSHTNQTTNKITLKKKILLASFVILLILAAGYFLNTTFNPSTQPIGTLNKSIAVLPFVDMSPNKDQEYLGDGIAEDIITALSKIQNLKVIGRTSSFQFKGEKIDLREVGDKLNVSTLLEGSVMKSGNKIRITAQLINVNDGSHIWAERYDKSMDDIFSIQDEISLMIAAKMKMTMLRDGSNADQKPTENIEAYENVLYGAQLMNRGFENAKAAIPFFEKAIQLDSNYVAAYEAMIVAYFFMPFSNEITSEGAVKKIDQLVQIILKLNPDSYMAHNQLFAINFFYNWNWEQAEIEFNKAKAINPRPDIGHALYSYYVYNDFKASEKEFLELISSNPLDKEPLRMLGNMYASNKQPDKAFDMLKKSIQIDPTYGSAYSDMGDVYLSIKEYKLAIDNYKKGSELSPRYGNIAGYITALMKLGKEKEAMSLFNSTELTQVPAGSYAQMCFAVGKITEGFEWLEKAFHNHDAQVIQFRAAPGFDPVRNDPRFIAIINKMNLPK